MIIADLSLLLPPFVAGLIVLTTHVPLGREVLKRGIIFIDLAIAQIAGLGVIAAHGFGWEAHGWEVQFAAMFAAVAGALLLTWTERQFAEIQEAVIGSLFILAASAGILLLANNPQGGEHLKELLVGQILWVEWHDLLPAAILYTLLLVAWFLFGNRLGRVGFYIIFAVAVTVSVQLIGVYLVFASLILPAIATYGIPPLRGLTIGYALGSVGYGIGLGGSLWLDQPAGPMVVISLTVVAIVICMIVRNSRSQTGHTVS